MNCIVMHDVDGIWQQEQPMIVYPKNEPCACSICEARRQGLPDTLALYFPVGSRERELVLEKPGMPVYWYEENAKRTA